MKVDIYDFDKTIYDGDSTAAFIKYCIKKHKAVLAAAIPALWAFFLYMLGIYTKTQAKEKMYTFLRYVPDIDAYVGQICAQELTTDLREPVGEPFLMFDSTDVPYSAQAPAHNRLNGVMVDRYGSDAPFINRLKNIVKNTIGWMI